ncbi:NUDIX domain-containing protein [Cupriavidus sp. AcVe19-1a]|uniref:NUDIX hydrolase n=1 Tax=Cupriavidus sp. AcVe19-1a TaxID=2821359 RepID=UPI001AE798B8|nr:NUDIX domain-containing protein [Cupriavidus sp. AcVe19-1a]MBP0631059.1 NUDIX domain-containing protein [Cupriavidus sp. AcVe19-1a]
MKPSRQCMLTPRITANLQSNKLLEQAHHYLSFFPDEADRIAPLISRITVLKLYSRKTLPGHVTASGIVIESNRILMIHHPFLQIWIPPGGHIEPGESALQAAKREVFEETGLQTTEHHWHEKNIIPFDIDIHTIPENREKQEPEHFHYDFRFLLKRKFGENILKGEHQCQWLDLNDASKNPANLSLNKIKANNIF